MRTTRLATAVVPIGCAALVLGMVSAQADQPPGAGGRDQASASARRAAPAVPTPKRSRVRTAGMAPYWVQPARPGCLPVRVDAGWSERCLLSPTASPAPLTGCARAGTRPADLPRNGRQDQGHSPNGPPTWLFLQLPDNQVLWRGRDGSTRRHRRDLGERHAPKEGVPAPRPSQFRWSACRRGAVRDALEGHLFGVTQVGAEAAEPRNPGETSADQAGSTAGRWPPQG